MLYAAPLCLGGAVQGSKRSPFRCIRASTEEPAVLKVFAVIPVSIVESEPRRILAGELPATEPEDEAAAPAPAAPLGNLLV